MKKEQYFVHYRDDGPKPDTATRPLPAESWSCLFVFDDFGDVVEWQEQDFQKLAGQRLHARVEDRWSTKYNSSEAHALFFSQSVRRKLTRRSRPPRTFRPPTGQKERFAGSLE